jgi:spore coat polysaccharide biosynthesis protein SpsF
VRRLVAALACRAGGSRLYGKPLQLLDIEGRLTVLEYMIDWIRTEPVVEGIVLGVAEGPENEPFHTIARRHGLRSIRGDETDVLMRLIQCGDAGSATDVLRLTTESPFTYFEALEGAWRRHCERANDVTSMGGLPDGTGFELITMATLRRSHERGEARHRSELCTLYVREHQDEFRVEVIEAPPSLQRLDVRLTIDYPEDLVLCRRVYEALRAFAPRIPVTEIVDYLDAHPEIAALVKPYAQAERWFA